ncbi:MAG: hypothetical protein ABW328_11365 [Ilumatobacteraceae bacterium]
MTEQGATQTSTAGGASTTVNFRDNGQITSRTDIPGDSAFVTSGERSSGGAPTPCGTFTRRVDIANPNPPPTTIAPDPSSSEPPPPTVPWPATITVDESVLSYEWIWREIDVTGDWTPEAQGVMEASDANLAAIHDTQLDMTSPSRFASLYYATTFPLATAVRRFSVSCGRPDGALGAAEVLLRYTEVPMADPFWNPLTRLGVLWGMVQLPHFRVVAPPEVNTYGGLVVNMPTWLQIEAGAWQPYFTAVDQYMGWYSQLGLFPHALAFEVVGPGGESIPCAPTRAAIGNGAIPAAPDDLPPYFELGQLGQDCTWVPQSRGSVTIRARITYDVLLTISGYSEWLSPYVWYSDPLSLTVDELHVRNVTPPGGIGG